MQMSQVYSTPPNGQEQGHQALPASHRQGLKDQLHRELDDPRVAGVEAIIATDIAEDLAERRRTHVVDRGRGIQMVRQIKGFRPNLNRALLAPDPKSAGQGQDRKSVV